MSQNASLTPLGLTPLSLTIAIPTFNRSRALRRTVASILPQMTPNCRLLILDNASPQPAREVLHDLLAMFPDARVEVRRNRANIGGNANILRCFEECETAYLWTLGDDDQPLPDAIERIFVAIAAQPDCVFWNFATSLCPPRPQQIKTRGLHEFAARLDAWPNINFISTDIWKRDALAARLSFGHQYAYSNAPHSATLLATLSDLGREGVCCLSPERIVEFLAPEAAQQWSVVDVALGLPVLLEMPMDESTRRLLARHLTFPPPLLLPLIMMQVLSAARNDPDGARFLFDHLCARHFYFDSSLKLRIQIALCRVLLHHPHLARKGYELLYRLKHRAPLQWNQHAPEERFARL